MLGETVGSYRILRKLGEGGMGAVYVAEHLLLRRHAAIKLLLRDLSHRQDLVTRFFNEARAATAVKHPGIIEIYDFGRHTDGSAYIVMEYLEGESLAARLERARTLPELRAAALCRQLASALGAAHAKGVVHRDLKPDNVFIVRDPDIPDGERTKILDFGIAKLTAVGAAGGSITDIGSILGTPLYMSPEQCRGRGIDHRADLYALGCMLFEMVCGRPPFVAEGGAEIMAQHILMPVPLPSSVRSVTPQLEQVILRALAKYPAQRFQSADEMMAALHVPVSDTSFHTRVPEPSAVPVLTSGPASGALQGLPLPARVIAVGPQSTTFSHSSGDRSIVGGPAPRRWLWAPAIAVAMLVLGAVGTAVHTLGQADVAGESAVDSTAMSPAVAAKPTPVPAAPARSPEPAAPASSPTTSGYANAAAAPASARPQAPSGASSSAPSATTASRPAMSPASVVARRTTVSLMSDPTGVDVYLMPQAEQIGTTPLSYPVPAGRATVMLSFRKQGYLEKQVSISSDNDVVKKVTLVKATTKAAPPPRPPDAGSGAGSANAATPASVSLDPFEKLDTTTRRR